MHIYNTDYRVLFWLKSKTASWHVFRCEQIIFTLVLIKLNGLMIKQLLYYCRYFSMLICIIYSNKLQFH